MEFVPGKTSSKLLAGLSDDDASLLRPSLALVEFPVRKLIESRNRRIEFAYFLEGGLASVVASGGSNHSVEVAIIGREGMTGLPLIFATDRSPHETFMQAAGSGWRIAAADLTHAMEKSPSLRRRLLHYAHSVMVQMAFTALANGRYKIEERLARWLLMAHDRFDGPDVALTHEFLSVMLGARRPGITMALNDLEKQGIIRAKRGLVTIVDRHALEETANGSYGMAEVEAERLFGEQS